MRKRLFSKYILLFLGVFLFWLLTNGFNVTFKKRTDNNSVQKVIMKESNLEDLTLDLNPNPYYYLNKYETVLKCNEKLSMPKWTRKSLISKKQTKLSDDYLTVAPNSTYNERVLRAIIVYFPVESQRHFEYEFKVNSIFLSVY